MVQDIITLLTEGLSVITIPYSGGLIKRGGICATSKSTLLRGIKRKTLTPEDYNNAQESERCILYIHSAKVLIGHLEIRRFFRDVFPVL